MGGEGADIWAHEAGTALAASARQVRIRRVLGTAKKLVCPEQKMRG